MFFPLEPVFKVKQQSVGKKNQKHPQHNKFTLKKMSILYMILEQNQTHAPKQAMFDKRKSLDL